MKYIYTFLFVAISATSFAQGGNLQFNQVLTFVGNTTETNIYTVPTGKVAKITKAIDYYESTPAYKVRLTFNGYTGQQYSTFDLSGMWLRENDFLGSIVGQYPQENKWILSIIEYNVIP
jgi:hypothetical protein